MIVDDRRVIVRAFLPYSVYHFLIFVPQMGSANLNDRSQKVRTPPTSYLQSVVRYAHSLFSG